MDPRANFSPISVFKTEEPAPVSNAPAPEPAKPASALLSPDGGLAGSGFIPRAAPPTAPTLPPFAMTAATGPAPSAAAAMLDEPDVQPVVSSSAAIIRTLTLVLKLSISASILMGGAYFTMKSVMPVIKELMHPGGTSALHDKDAPTFVKAIQQTRQVVAKNDANVAYLDSLVGEPPKEGRQAPITPLASAGPGQTASRSLPAAPVGTKTPVAPPQPEKTTTYSPSSSSSSLPFVLNLDADTPAEGTPAPRVSTTDPAVFGDAVDRLKIDGVVGGRSPRIMIDGLLVKVGGIADYRLNLKFTGVDADHHLLFFTNEDNRVFKRRY